MKNEDVSKVLNDVQDMKGRQDEMTMKLDQIKRCETFQLFGMIAQWRGGGTGRHGFSHIWVLQVCATG